MKFFLFHKSVPSKAFSNPAHHAANSALEELLDHLANVAIVSEDIRPFQPGRVQFQSSWWPAVCPQNVQIPSGKPVRVIGRSNITLLVEPILNCQDQ